MDIKLNSIVVDKINSRRAIKTRLSRIYPRTERLNVIDPSSEIGPSLGK